MVIRTRLHYQDRLTCDDEMMPSAKPSHQKRNVAMVNMFDFNDAKLTCFKFLNRRNKFQMFKNMVAETS